MSKIPSKPWDWGTVNDKKWEKPDKDLARVGQRWKEQGIKKVLDLGCGIGRHSLYLASLDMEVTAMDLGAEGIKKLEDKRDAVGLQDKITTLVCDMLKIDLEADTLDAVVAFQSINHTDSKGLKKVIATIQKLLRPRGRIFVVIAARKQFAGGREGDTIVDKNTIIRGDGNEKGVPHIFLDEQDVHDYFAGFNIQGLGRGGTSGRHWVIEGTLR